MIYRAAAALPHDDRDLATADLRGQLRLMAVAAGGTPNWSTLEVRGPVQVVGLHRAVWHEWTATVSVNGCRYDLDDASVDAVIKKSACTLPATVEAHTAPYPAGAESLMA